MTLAAMPKRMPKTMYPNAAGLKAATPSVATYPVRNSATDALT